MAHQSHWSVWAASFLLLILAAGTALVWLIHRPSTTSCEEKNTASSTEHWFKAVDVLVQPWQGRHQVYGLFKVPEIYKQHKLYFVTLTIKGLEEQYSAGSPDIEERDNIVPERGYYFRKAYIPTRAAWWFLFTGRFGDLRNPCHWWLIYSHRTL